jgi:glucokinase
MMPLGTSLPPFSLPNVMDGTLVSSDSYREAKCNKPALFAGIEIGGTKLQVVRGNAKGEILQRSRFTVDPSRGAASIQAQILSGLSAVADGHSLSGIGVGFGGPVNHATGIISKSHQIEGWTGFPIGAWLRSETGLPTCVDNDANVAALGEASHGAGKGQVGPLFYVTLGSGVGGGLVYQGKIYHGTVPGEAEIGHIRLNKSGLIVENSCSGWAVDRKIRHAMTREPAGWLARHQSLAAGGEARLMAQALSENDPAAHAILQETADDLAFALSHIVHLLHPQTIVLGGGLSLLGKPLFQEVGVRLNGYVMDAFHPVPVLLPAALGEDAVPVGALVLAAGG